MQRRGCRLSPPGRAAPQRGAGALGAFRRRPRNPTPTAAARSRGHRPQAAGPARGGGRCGGVAGSPVPAAPSDREIKACSMRLVCSASHIRRATSCSTRAHRKNEKKKKKKTVEAGRPRSRPLCLQGVHADKPSIQRRLPHLLPGLDRLPPRRRTDR